MFSHLVTCFFSQTCLFEAGLYAADDSTTLTLPDTIYELRHSKKNKVSMWKTPAWKEFITNDWRHSLKRCRVGSRPSKMVNIDLLFICSFSTFYFYFILMSQSTVLGFMVKCNICVFQFFYTALQECCFLQPWLLKEKKKNLDNVNRREYKDFQIL